MSPQNERHLAHYAVRSEHSDVRSYVEPTDRLRGPFELDRKRIIESTAFRRLEGKTQVFAPSAHDHFRTRMTHSVEVALVARTLAVALGANESLAEAIALAHDLGHPPFGHAGEKALDETMTTCGGFNHNAHSLRVVEYLEHPYPPFRGLNLTEETRAGLAGHQTQYDKPAGEDGEHVAGLSVEGMIASIADRIAYDCHDLEDAIGAGFVDLAALNEVTLWHEAHDRANKGGRMGDTGASIHSIRRVVLDELLQGLLIDVVETSRARLAGMSSPQQAFNADSSLVSISPSGDRLLAQLESFLAERVYRHTAVAAMDDKGQRQILALCGVYKAQPKLLPRRFADRVAEQGIDRVVCDYVAGMTDAFCTREFTRVAGTSG